ncbi:MAG: M1 family metallopeptidase [Bacteroidota bacterium]
MLPHPEVDVQAYRFYIELFDSTNQINGMADVSFIAPPKENLVLDLIQGSNAQRGGMQVLSVTQNDKPCVFIHENNQINIRPNRWEDTMTVRISYQGQPRDGLIISRNRHQHRTFFGDNWPNRARNWLPVVDHPLDKALMEFVVSAPAHYQVVSNGQMHRLIDLGKGRRQTTWRTDVPIPTKVAVIGVAEFAREEVGKVDRIPVSTWVYPEDRTSGFYDYALAASILDSLDAFFGPYPFAKLANVQSTTRYGGMENASCIFYSETSIDGKRGSESLLAHEIVHQWFGNSASEASWYHIWLSEGFATYFTGWYLEQKYGAEALAEYLSQARARVIQFGPKKPVVDSSVTDLNDLLNANSYQKGAWVLHMLRRKLGDETFRRGIQTYYQRFKLGNALTQDFQQVMEEVSGQALDDFFTQWLFRPGHPRLELTWSYQPSEKALLITVEQMGALFNFPLELEVVGAKGKQRLQFEITDQRHQFQLPMEKAPLQVNPDPGVNLLAEFD